MAETNRVTLRSERTPDGEVSLLEAYIDDSGDLVLEGYDLGETVKEVWGDPDYLRTADLRDADLRGARFTRTDLFRVDLRGARLDPANRNIASAMGAFLGGDDV